MAASNTHPNTATWRKLRFETIEDCEAEVGRIVAADKEGRLSSCGEWTPGQNLAHIAAWIEYAYEGFPLKGPPALIRWFMRLRLRKMLATGLPRGVRIPGVKGGTAGMDDMSTADAADRLLKALQRLVSAETAPYDSPAFGPMTHAQRIQLNLRHAELHLGYLTY